MHFPKQNGEERNLLEVIYERKFFFVLLNIFIDFPSFFPSRTLRFPKVIHFVLNLSLPDINWFYLSNFISLRKFLSNFRDNPDILICVPLEYIKNLIFLRLTSSKFSSVLIVVKEDSSGKICSFINYKDFKFQTMMINEQNFIVQNI